MSLYITLYNQIKSNIVAIKNLNTDQEYQTLQLRFIHEKHDIIPKNWLLNLSKKNYVDKIFITNKKSMLLEQDTVAPREKKEFCGMMGHCGASFRNTAVFVLNDMIIVRTYFQKDFFIGLIDKINSFYKIYSLLKVLTEFEGKKWIKNSRL